MATMVSRISLVVAVVAFAASLVTALGVPMCAEIDGFASGVNANIEITPNVLVRPGEAIVLVARPVPSTAPIRFKLVATFPALGETVTRESDLANGLIQIYEPLAFGDVVHISIVALDATEPVPFVFFSYIANVGQCYLTLAPGRTFSAPLLRAVYGRETAVGAGGVVGNPGSMHVRLVNPGQATSVAISVSTPHDRAAVQFSTGDGTGAPGSLNAEGSTNVAVAVGKEVFVVITPSTALQSNNDVIVLNAVWNSAPAAPLTLVNPGTNGVVGGPVLVPGPVDQLLPTPAPTPAPETVAEETRGALGAVLWWLAAGTVVYMVVRSAYNYKVKGVTEFPQFVPHHEGIAAFGSGVAIFVGSLSSRARGQPLGNAAVRPAGYSQVDRDELHA